MRRHLDIRRPAYSFGIQKGRRRALHPANRKTCPLGSFRIQHFIGHFVEYFQICPVLASEEWNFSNEGRENVSLPKREKDLDSSSRSGYWFLSWLARALVGFAMGKAPDEGGIGAR